MYKENATVVDWLIKSHYLTHVPMATGDLNERADTKKRSSVDAEHLFRFHVWTQNICSVFALEVAFSNLSGIATCGRGLSP